jgi:hypothetical protein
VFEFDSSVSLGVSQYVAKRIYKCSEKVEQSKSATFPTLSVSNGIPLKLVFFCCFKMVGRYLLNCQNPSKSVFKQ